MQWEEMAGREVKVKPLGSVTQQEVSSTAEAPSVAASDLVNSSNTSHEVSSSCESSTARSSEIYLREESTSPRQYVPLSSPESALSLLRGVTSISPRPSLHPQPTSTTEAEDASRETQNVTTHALGENKL